jgi:hypothetical protein
VVVDCVEGIAATIARWMDTRDLTRFGPPKVVTPYALCSVVLVRAYNVYRNMVLEGVHDTLI